MQSPLRAPSVSKVLVATTPSWSLFPKEERLTSALAVRLILNSPFLLCRSNGKNSSSRRPLCHIRVIGELVSFPLMFISVLTSSTRGVRRLSMRKWEKAVADGNVEQMFGMNIKQEGIEVLGDQVWYPAFRSNGSDIEPVYFCETSSSFTDLGCLRSLDSCLASYLGTPARFLRRPNPSRRARRARRGLHCRTLCVCHIAVVGQMQDLL